MGKLIVGNWKMNGTLPLSREFAALAFPPEVVICPPLTLLHALQGKFTLGAQDCSNQAGGAFTGDISAAMLKEAGCSYVILGHSERRATHGETDAQVAAKARAALAADLTPIICVGETRQVRQSGRAAMAVSAQARGSVPAELKEPVLAYEPVWAIGSGETPTPAEIQAVHVALHRTFPGAKVLYGGSVKAQNAKEILAISEVNGVLVGGASLNTQEFSHIVAAAKE